VRLLSPSAILNFKKPSMDLEMSKPGALWFLLLQTRSSENPPKLEKFQPQFAGLTKNQSPTGSGSLFIAGVGFEPTTSGL
jgi:hypothetical protein